MPRFQKKKKLHEIENILGSKEENSHFRIVCEKLEINNENGSETFAPVQIRISEIKTKPKQFKLSTQITYYFQECEIEKDRLQNNFRFNTGYLKYKTLNSILFYIMCNYIKLYEISFEDENCKITE